MTHQFIITEELNPLENLLKVIISIVNKVYLGINKIAGMVGVIIILPLFSVFMFFLWVVLLVSNNRLRKLTRELLNDVQNCEDARDLRLMHHAIKTRRIEVDRIIHKSGRSRKFFLIAPVFTQLVCSRNLFFEAEESLHKTAYPGLYRPLTREQIEELEKYSRSLEGVWEDNDQCLSE